MRETNPEWARYAALQYIRRMADYRAACMMDAQAIEETRARAEAVGAIRYDRDGSPSGYRDRLPELMDAMDAARDRLAGRIIAQEREYQDALELFNSDPRARMAWAKYGERRTWAQVAADSFRSVATCRRWAATGLEIVFQGMPAEFRRVPYQAEEWGE